MYTVSSVSDLHRHYSSVLQENSGSAKGLDLRLPEYLLGFSKSVIYRSGTVDPTQPNTYEVEERQPFHRASVVLQQRKHMVAACILPEDSGKLLQWASFHVALQQLRLPCCISYLCFLNYIFTNFGGEKLPWLLV